MNFEPCDPPLLDPFILEQFPQVGLFTMPASSYIADNSENLLKGHLEFIKHKYVRQKLAESLEQRHCSKTHRLGLLDLLSKEGKDISNFAGLDQELGSLIPNDTNKSNNNNADHTINNQKGSKVKATKRFTYAQSVILEEFFQRYGSGKVADRVRLAECLGIYRNDVMMWFQSRRRKQRRQSHAAK